MDEINTQLEKENRKLERMKEMYAAEVVSLCSLSLSLSLRVFAVPRAVSLPKMHLNNVLAPLLHTTTDTSLVFRRSQKGKSLQNRTNAKEKRLAKRALKAAATAADPNSTTTPSTSSTSKPKLKKQEQPSNPGEPSKTQQKKAARREESIQKKLAAREAARLANGGKDEGSVVGSEVSDVSGDSLDFGAGAREFVRLFETKEERRVLTLFLSLLLSSSPPNPSNAPNSPPPMLLLPHLPTVAEEEELERRPRRRAKEEE